MSAGVVSIVIPTRNRARLLLRAIESVEAQTYRSWECVVVDDASTDGTEEAMRRFSGDSRFRYVRQPERAGSGAARNCGVALARGHLIAFLDDDDEWHPTKLEKQVRVMAESELAPDVVYCWMEYEDDRTAERWTYAPALRGDVFRHLITGNRVGGCPSLLIRAEAFRRSNGFRTDLRVQEDDELLLRLARLCQFDFVAEALVKVHVSHGLEQTSRRGQGTRLQATMAAEALRALFDIAREAADVYPAEVSTLCATLAQEYLVAGELRRGAECLCKAVTLRPRSLVPYRKLLGGVARSAAYALPSAFQRRIAGPGAPLRGRSR